MTLVTYCSYSVVDKVYLHFLFPFNSHLCVYLTPPGSVHLLHSRHYIYYCFTSSLLLQSLFLLLSFTLYFPHCVLSFLSSSIRSRIYRFVSHRICESVTNPFECFIDSIHVSHHLPLSTIVFLDVSFLHFPLFCKRRTTFEDVTRVSIVPRFALFVLIKCL